MKRIAVFDFDGTITNKDTLLEFIRFSRGHFAYYVGLLLNLPWLLLMKMRLYNNGKTKERLFSYFFKGTSFEQFEIFGQRFYENKVDSILYNDAISTIKRHKFNNDIVLILSASVETWIMPFANHLKIDYVLGTKIEVVDGVITGRFSSPNCYGTEKVRRLKEWITTNMNKQEIYVLAYGDSRGDKELLQYADEQYYKTFKR